MNIDSHSDSNENNILEEEDFEDFEETWWVCKLCQRGVKGVTALKQHNTEKHSNKILTSPIESVKSKTKIKQVKLNSSMFMSNTSPFELITVSDDDDDCHVVERSVKTPKVRRTVTELGKLGVTDDQLLDIALGQVGTRLRERVTQREDSSFNKSVQSSRVKNSTIEKMSPLKNGSKPEGSTESHNLREAASKENMLNETLKLRKTNGQVSSSVKSKGFVSKKINHITENNSIGSSDSLTEDKKSSRKLICLQCSMTFDNANALLTHCDRVHNFRCNYCGQAFMHEANLISHCKVHLLDKEENLK